MRHSAFFSVFSEEVSVTLPDDLKGATAGIIGADGSVKGTHPFQLPPSQDYTVRNEKCYNWKLIFFVSMVLSSQKLHFLMHSIEAL